MSKPLAGKIALVTGGSRGIGRAIVERLARDGAHVIVHFGGNAEAASTAVAAARAHGVESFAVQADLAAPGAVGQLFSAVDRELAARNLGTTFDILINNAGIAPFASIPETTEAMLDQIYTVNVKAPFLITQEAAKRLRDGGRIVNFSSVVARLPYPAVAAYSALKAPIDNFTKSFALDYGPRGITVNTVAPGAIQTDMSAWLDDPAGAEAGMSKQALKRVGQATDVADAVAFLVSDDARWITGQTIEVSGGTAIGY